MKERFVLMFWGALIVLAIAFQFLPHKESVVYETPKPIIDRFEVVPSRKDNGKVVHSNESRIFLHTIDAVKREVLYQGADADADTLYRDNAEVLEARIDLTGKRLEGEIWARAYNSKGDFTETEHMPITYERPEAVVYQPDPGTLVTTPIKIKGQAKGTWFFEASLPATLLDANGKLLAKAPLTAKSDWMTTDFVEFEGSVSFVRPETDTGTLIIAKDNPSGLPSNDQSISIPIRFR